MTKERNLTLTGRDKNEALEALKAIKKFSTKKPEKRYYRHVYISVNSDGVEHTVSDGGVLGKTLNVDDLITKAEITINETVNFERFFISATIRKD